MSRPEAQSTEANLRRSRSMQFRKRSKAPPQSPDEARRQNHVIRCAWRHFGSPGPVIAFLNTRHASLEEQPLHLAIESDDGLKRVEALLDSFEGGQELHAVSLATAQHGTMRAVA